MALETSLRAMAKHLVARLDADRLSITTSDGSPAFEKVVYGEPRVIASWPLLSVQPQQKVRDLREGATRKFRISFTIDLVLYHGAIADTLDVQEATHERAEAVESWVMGDLKWNFIDSTDSSKHKVIFGSVVLVDHPVVIAPGQELWSASRCRLEAISEEVF